MVSCRFGGVDGFELDLKDQGDLVVVRSHRRGARHDVSPLSRRSRSASARLTPLFGFPVAGVGVYAAPPGESEELSTVLHGDPEIQFAGRGFRDPYGAPVVYTENLFVKFVNEAAASEGEQALRGLGLSIKRALDYAGNAFFASAPEGVGREVFPMAQELLEREDVELCHPEVIREVRRRDAFAQQWHLHPTVIGGQAIDAHAHVSAAWPLADGSGVTICIIDDGVDVDHEEFATPDKVVRPRAVAQRSDDARPGEGDNHGTGCAGVACAEGRHGASGVAPKARLMPVRLKAGLGSQDEADAFVWASDNGADVISCSWGPADGEWWNADDRAHDAVVPLADNTRLAIEYAVTKGRGGRGCVITWAAGNGNESVDNDGYASSEKVVAVAACNDRGQKSAYSDWGNAVWCCFPSDHGEPSLTPGVWTTDRSGPEGYNSGHPSLGDAGGNYTNSFGGTSSACPGVAGVAALVLSRNSDLRWEEVKEILRQSCDRIDDTPGEYDDHGHSKRYGYGRVNAEVAVQLAGRGSAPAG